MEHNANNRVPPTPLPRTIIGQPLNDQNGVNNAPPPYYAGPNTMPYPAGAPTGPPPPYATPPYGCEPAGQAPGYWPPQPQPGVPPPYQQPGVSPYPQPGVPPYQQPGVPPYQQPGVPPYQQPGVPSYPYGTPGAQPSLYPTLPTQDTTVVPDVGTPSAPPFEGSLAPARPAPPRPNRSSGGYGFESNGGNPVIPNSTSSEQISSKAAEASAPPGMVIGWQCGSGLKLYFLQHDGNCVAPDRPLNLVVYTQNKALGSRRSSTTTPAGEEILGCIEVPGVWRLNLKGNSSFLLHKSPDIYAFLDDSTDPSKSGRITLLQLPKEVSPTMKNDLNNLLKELTHLRIEELGYLNQITSGVGTVYEGTSKKLSSFAKGSAPGVMQSTKGLRKGTGSLLRTGGNLLAKGMNLVATQVNGETPQTETVAPEHLHLGESVDRIYKHIQDETVTMA